MSLAGVSKSEFAGVALGIWVSLPAIFSLAYGLAGMRGHSALSGAALAVCLLAIPLLLLRRVAFRAADFCFVLLALSMMCTFAIGAAAPASTVESALLFVTLASYVACRFFTDEALAEGCAPFVAVCVTVVGLGTLATVVALIQNWDARPKPMVLGSGATPTQLVQILAFPVLASLTLVTLTIRRAVVIAAMAAIPVAAFSAAQVRFSLAALVGSVGLVAMLSKGGQRKLAMLVGCVIVLAAVMGALARYSKTQVLANYALETASGAITWERPPSCDLNTNTKNSIAIRKALVLDGLYLAPRAGFFGTGLDGFMQLSCVRQTEIHNSFLQAFVEFGWLGGVLFLVLVVTSVCSIAGRARAEPVPLFLLSSLIFLAMIAIAYGRLSRDFTLFAFLGVVGGYAESRLRRQQSGQ
ncbi:hypothetical protein [Bradyrhizobium sp.]|uniref:hypothetical protein n=1 Tax=Bradyrhizobium sp. TaxID=376 RepID=UPI001D9ECA07|nr:hypothetical protein [Bradyrhizobium sp.]MBI5320508.1 hypothetical protein [Bradyrhizobium sp.]